MIRNHEDEFIAVRVQDPRHQNEGSWNSYVDYKIFLHTNSKAFTAKTSCVRRRYSEFVWLKKNMQKNAGLVPVPDLPGKSLFSFNNEDFLESRRKGLQTFLHAVLHMTVFLSESLLHLFLQTQLPVSHIQDCVQGHTPYTVTDAILTYASSNRGLAQAQTQEDDVMKEPSLITVSYESMESPVLHVPTPPYKSEASPPGLPSPSERDPPEALVEGHSADLQLGKTKTSSVKVRQGPHHLEAIVEQHSPMGATFYLGETPDDRACEVQTPVEVRSPKGYCCEDGRRASEESSGRPADPGPEPDGEESDEVASVSEVRVEIHNVNTADGFHDLDVSPDHLEQTLAERGEVDSVRNGREEGCDYNGDSQSSQSSDGSIAKISDEEEYVTDEREATTQNANVYSSAEDVVHMTDAESSSRDILRLETNCYSLERGSILSADRACVETNGVQDAKGEELLYISDIGTLAKALDLESSSRPNGVGDCSDNGELCSPERDCEAESVSGECSEHVTQPSSLCLESSE